MTAGVASNRRVVANTIAPGVERITFYSMNNAPVPAGVVLNLKFTIAQNASNGTSFVTLTNAPFSDTNAAAMTNLLLVRGTNTVFGAPDRVNPTVAITRPTPGQVFTNTNTTLAGTATDNDGVGRVLYSVNGGVLQTAQGMAT